MISSTQIVNLLYPKPTGPRIDMWEMTHEYQIFGYWPNGSLAGPECPPEKTLKFDIQPNGNLLGDPEPEPFYEWLGHCRKNPELFNIDEYISIFADKPED